MINQISLSSANKNVFVPFKSNGATFDVVKPFTETQETENKKEEKKNGGTGYKIARIALLSTIGALLLAKGMPKNARLKLDNIFKFLEEKSAKLAENKRLTDAENLYLKTLKSAKSLTKYFKATFTLAPLKDVLVLRAMQKSPSLDRIGQKITNLFEKISVKTSKRAYSKTLINLDEMFANFAEANTKIPRAHAEILENMAQDVRAKYIKAFSEEARNKRLAEAKRDMKDVDKKFWDLTYKNFKRFFKDKNTYQTFLSEEIVAPAKLKHTREVNGLKEGITISPHNNYNDIKTLLNNIDTFINPTDKPSRTLVKNIRNNLRDYEKALEEGKNVGDMLWNKGVIKNLDELNAYLLKAGEAGKYDKKATEQVSETIRDLNKILIENKKGEIQEMMDVYRSLLSEKDYLKLRKSTNKTLKSLDKAIDLETDKLFDKIRDLMIGSAVCDSILHVLLPTGIIAWSLSKAKDNDERISIALKAGIPIIGGLAVSLYCTVGLIAGGPSILIGLISGIAIERLGRIIDDMRKKYKEKEPILTMPNINLKPIDEVLEPAKESTSASV